MARSSSSSASPLRRLGVIAGGPSLALGWPALAFLVVGVAYLRGTPALLGKRRDGTHSRPGRFALVGPFLAFAWAVVRLERAITREDAFNEVAPGLWVGRFPRGAELPDGVRWVVDLTAELSAEESVRRRVGYLCEPVLDATAPEIAVLQALVTRLSREPGLFVHCASGHGRSATLAAALLIARGEASSADDAVARMKQRRPRIQLTAMQKATVSAAMAPATTREPGC
jgi:protein-tyrosine phosphatase